MAGFVDARENAILNLIWGGSVLTPPATWYVALLLSLPAEDGTAVIEPVGNSYARVGVANNLTQWPSAVSGLKANANPIVFAPATGAGWGTVTHYGFFDAENGGSLWAFSSLDAPRSIALGDSFQFLTGDCRMSMD